MSEKVKLTKRQLNELRNYKGTVDGTITRELATFINSNQDWNARWKSLKKLSPEQFALVLCGWYEVEPEYKVGDWIVNEHLHKVIKLNKKQANNVNSLYSPHHIRHATESEIAEEKERRFFAEHGRILWELREDDVLIDDVGDIYKVTCPAAVDGFIEIDEQLVTAKHIKEFFKVLCFAENRLDRSTE